MNKLKRFYSKHLKNKFIALGVLFVAVLFFTNDLSLADIEQTAIVAAVAVDKTQEGTYKLMCETLNASGAQEKSALYAADGSTLDLARSNLEKLSGKSFKNNFCSLILFSENTVRSQAAEEIVAYFYALPHFNDTALLAACTDPFEVLSQKKQETTVSENITAILSRSDRSETVSVNLNDVMLHLHSVSKTYAIPLLKDAATTAAGEGGDQSGSSAPSNEYDLTSSVVIFPSGNVLELTPSETVAYNFMTKHKAETHFPQGKLKRASLKKQVVYDGTRFVVSATMRLKSNDTTVPPNAEIADVLTGMISELFVRAKEQNCDVFSLTDAVYKKFPKEYASDTASDFLKNVDLTVRVKV